LLRVFPSSVFNRLVAAGSGDPPGPVAATSGLPPDVEPDEVGPGIDWALGWNIEDDAAVAAVG
jgi:hypothetical protein